VRTLKILGEEYRLVFSDLDAEAWAYCDSERKEIQISKSAKKNKKLLNEILFHEIVHAAFARVGINQVLEEETEEIICETLAKIFYDLGVRLL
jgi:hypothetical protein